MSECVLLQEGLEVGRKDRRLIDRNQRRATIDPNEVGVLEAIRQALSMPGWHQLILAGPHDQNVALEGALLLSPFKQLRPLRDAAEIFVQIAADLAIEAQWLDPAEKLIIGYTPLQIVRRMQSADAEGSVDAEAARSGRCLPVTTR